MGVQMADGGIGVIRQKCQGLMHGSIGKDAGCPWSSDRE